MFTYIKGQLTESNPHHVTLETHGIGYKIHIPIHLHSLLPPLQTEMKLFVSFIIREYSHSLYGFTSGNERDLFEQLLDVSGIGPKLALSLIGHMPAAELAQAIADNNLIKLCKVPGIGKKTAERLVMELRNKVLPITPYTHASFNHGLDNDPRTQTIHDAMSALINLGYNQLTAQKALKKSMQLLSDNATLAEWITASLKNI